MDEHILPNPTPKDLSGATEEELASFGLRKNVAMLCDDLRYAIDSGAEADTLHNIVGLWEFNHGDLDFDELADWGRPCSCEDCGTNVMPYDEEGRLVEGACEWYMATTEVWQAAAGTGDSVWYLCIGCLEQRLGRGLGPGDFSDAPVNQPSILDTPRLHTLLVEREADLRHA